MGDKLNMNLDDLLSSRYSVRAFKPDPIPQATLDAIFTTAQMSPSNCNTQPWQVFVASGAKCDEVRQTLVDIVSAGTEPTPEFLYYDGFTKELRVRRVVCARELYDCMGVERNDKVGRAKAMLRNFELFDAPHVAFICIPPEFGKVNVLDIGIYLQTLMLAMHSHGVASCAQGALSLHPAPIKKLLGIDDDLGIIVGVSFGFEDTEVPANKTRTTREPIDKSVTFLS